MSPQKRAAWLILLYACIVCFSRLGEAPVYIENEAREGIYVRAMLQTGDYLLPQVPNHVEEGETVPDKPPLFHWLAVLGTVGRAFAQTGQLSSGAELSPLVDEWALRFPSALAGVLTVAGLLLLGPGIVGTRAAFIAALCLLTSWQFVMQAHYGRVDMALACFVTWSMLLLGRALLSERCWPLAGAAAMSGLAVLSKGPLGLALPALAGAAWVGLESVQRASTAWLRRYCWWPAALVLGLVALPYYVVTYAKGGMAVFHSQILTETIHQFSGANARMRPWYYLAPWLVGSLPWNLMALAGIVRSVRRRDRRAMFCAVWWLVFMAFFTIAAYKRRAYLLPALPAASLLAGYWLDSQLPSVTEALLRLRTWLATRWRPLVTECLAAGILSAVLVMTPGASATMNVVLPMSAVLATGLGSAVFVAGALLLIRAARSRDGWFALLALWLGLVGLLLGPESTGEYVQAINKSPRPLVNRVLHSLPRDQRVTLLGIGDQPSLLAVFYFPDDERISVVPEGGSATLELGAGYYLLGQQTWSYMSQLNPASLGDWELVWRDTLRERNRMIPVVLARHISDCSGSAAPPVRQTGCSALLADNSLAIFRPILEETPGLLKRASVLPGAAPTMASAAVP